MIETAEDRKVAKDEIFQRVCVCRSFRLEGLLEILKRTDSQVEPTTLFMWVGDLNASGHFRTLIGSYIVNHDKAKETISKWNDSLYCEEHNNWRDWYKSEFEKKWKGEDLAELLYLEAASFRKGSHTARNILDHLKLKTTEYLHRYIQAKQLQKQPGEIANYIENLIKQIQLDILNRLHWILPNSEDEIYIKFLNELCRLLGSGYNTFIKYLRSLDL